MYSPIDPRPHLSAENSDRLERALLLSRELKTPAQNADTKLCELKGLLDRCRQGIRRQNPSHGEVRLEAVNQARNYLHFLPDMQQADAAGRLRSVSRRLQRALRAG